MGSNFKRIWKKFKAYLIHVLQDKEDPATHTNNGKVTPIKQNPGLDCPQCGVRISISIPMLLSGEPIYCATCNLKLTLDQDKSAGCLAELHKVQEAIHRAEQASQR